MELIHQLQHDFKGYSINLDRRMSRIMVGDRALRLLFTPSELGAIKLNSSHGHNYYQAIVYALSSRLGLIPEKGSLADSLLISQELALHARITSVANQLQIGFLELDEKRVMAVSVENGTGQPQLEYVIPNSSERYRVEWYHDGDLPFLGEYVESQSVIVTNPIDTMGPRDSIFHIEDRFLLRKGGFFIARMIPNHPELHSSENASTNTGEIKQHIIGIGGFISRDEKISHVEYLQVSRPNRHVGIGTSLLEAMEKEARRTRHKEMRVVLRDEEHGRFLHKRGYTRYTGGGMSGVYRRYL